MLWVCRERNIFFKSFGKEEISLKAFNLTDQGQYVKTEDWVHADWVHIAGPSDADTSLLMETFGLPKDYILDSLDEYEISRQEMVRTKDDKEIQLLIVLFPVIKAVEDKYTEYHTFPLAIITTENKIITICKETPFFLNQIMQNKSFKNKPAVTKQHIVLNILWELTKSFVNYLREIDRTIEELQVTITRSTHNENFYKLIAIHKSLVYFETSIVKNHPLITNIESAENDYDDPQSKELLQDVINISNQADTMVIESSKMIDQLSEVFSSVISNNLNNIMKVLTSITIVLTIPTIIAGFWGMNVKLPFGENPAGFWMTAILTIIICIITIYWLKKKDYF